MLFGKGKKKIDEERQLHYGDGKLEKKNSEVIQDIRAYTMAARWFEKRVAEDYRKKARNSRRLSIFFGILAFASVNCCYGAYTIKNGGDNYYPC